MRKRRKEKEKQNDHSTKMSICFCLAKQIEEIKLSYSATLGRRFASLVKPTLSLFVFVIVFVLIVFVDGDDEEPLAFWSFACVEDKSVVDVLSKLGTKISRVYPYDDRKNGII